MAKSKTVNSYNNAKKYLKEKIERLETQGFTVPKDYIPKTPKNITEGSTRRIKSLTKDIYEKSTYYDPYTGQHMSGFKGKALVERTREFMRDEGTYQSGDTINVWDVNYTRFNELLDEAYANSYVKNESSKQLIKMKYESLKNWARMRYAQDPSSFGQALSYNLAEVPTYMTQNMFDRWDALTEAVDENFDNLTSRVNESEFREEFEEFHVEDEEEY